MNILAFFAHPDDETMLCGGTLALLARNGAAVHYLCATRGEGGELGEPPVCSREQIAQVRSQELTCAVSALGGASLQFLNYVDPLVGPNDDLFAFQADEKVLIDQLSEILVKKDIDVLITHGSNGEYGHPAHLLVHKAALEAGKQMTKNQFLIYTVQANFPSHPKPRIANTDDPADIILDIHPVLKQKTQAAMCHHTQHALFVRRTSKRMGHPVTIPEVIMAMEALHCVFPRKTSEEDQLSRLLHKTGFVIEEYKS